MNKQHVGSNFNDFLKQENLRAECEANAFKRVVAWQLQQEMKPRKISSHAYDAEADVLYINFKKPSQATDSELTEYDIIVRYENEEVVGLTVLHASKR